MFWFQVNFIMDLIYEYLPSIVITMANFITPLLFSIIINYEDYSPAFEIRFTLIRYNKLPLTDHGNLKSDCIRRRLLSGKMSCLPIQEDVLCNTISMKKCTKRREEKHAMISNTKWLNFCL